MRGIPHPGPGLVSFPAFVSGEIGQGAISCTASGATGAQGGSSALLVQSMGASAHAGGQGRAPLFTLRFVQAVGQAGGESRAQLAALRTLTVAGIGGGQGRTQFALTVGIRGSGGAGVQSRVTVGTAIFVKLVAFALGGTQGFARIVFIAPLGDFTGPWRPWSGTRAH